MQTLAAHLYDYVHTCTIYVQSIYYLMYHVAANAEQMNLMNETRTYISVPVD